MSEWVLYAIAAAIAGVIVYRIFRSKAGKRLGGKAVDRAKDAIDRKLG